MNMTCGRILIFIVAYQAEKHLVSVLDRIPSELINDPNIEILIIDDGSSDAGVKVGKNWAEINKVERITVLRNPVNQGYGGNQKLGYRIGIDTDFDFIILLHGDGQYAPELLPLFIKTWQETKADVVLGSRMQDLKSAQAGGMPKYKMVGNLFLTKIQNMFTGKNLSEYHTGYRGYSASFLKRIPFELNTNEFHFDTEILLQAFQIGAHIEEFPIPTHYGNEICHVNGIQYAKDVFLSTLRYKMHQYGMLCDLKYRRITPERYNEKSSMEYSSHAIALSIVKKYRPNSILDLGCGPGFIARQCRNLGIDVTGVDIFEPLENTVDHFRRMNLEKDPPPEDAFKFDMILLLDVLEHFAEPEKFLLELRNNNFAIKEDQALPLLIISTPNVAFATIRLNLLLGRFNYAERGILDITHKRLFTRTSLLHMLQECGYNVEKIYTAAAPFQAVMKGSIGNFLGWLAAILAHMLPSLFAFQFVIVCRPLPGVKQLIHNSERYHTVSHVLSAFLEYSQVKFPDKKQ
jgi:glycosyltransferase involved in cell wall biosynthesis